MPFVLELGCVAVLLFGAALGAPDATAGVAAVFPTPPPTENLGFEDCGWTTRIVSETPLFCGGEFGGEEIDEELS